MLHNIFYANMSGFGPGNNTKDLSEKSSLHIFLSQETETKENELLN